MVSRRTFLASSAGAMLLPAMMPGTALSEEKPQGGGVLRIAVNKDMRHVNPLLASMANEIQITANLYANLTRIMPNGELVPDMAESWSASEDARTWTFKLRDGLRFHDGSAVDAEDVVATIAKALDPTTAAPFATELKPIESLRAIDAGTVEITLSSSYADLPRVLTAVPARIISRKGIEKGDVETVGYGCGPFLLDQFIPNDRIVLKKNPNYHREGRPYLDQIEYRILPDMNTQLAALAKGEVDVVADANPDLVDALQAKDSVKVLNASSGTFFGLVLYANKPPFNNPDVLRAAKLALDRKVMVQAASNGHGQPGNDQPLFPGYAFFDKNLALLEPNLAEAKELMKKAGYENGLDHKVVVSNTPPGREREAVVIQAMLQQVGIRLDLEVMDNARYGQTVFNKGEQSYINYWGSRATEDAILSKLYSAKNGIDEGRWATPESEAILDEARTTLDPERRKELYAQFQKLVRDTGSLLIPNFYDLLAVAAKNVMDFPLNPVAYERRLDDVWISKA